jgi:hypothetical protein
VRKALPTGIYFSPFFAGVLPLLKEKNKSTNRKEMSEKIGKNIKREKKGNHVQVKRKYRHQWKAENRVLV